MSFFIIPALLFVFMSSSKQSICSIILTYWPKRISPSFGCKSVTPNEEHRTSAAKNKNPWDSEAVVLDRLMMPLEKLTGGRSRSLWCCSCTPTIRVIRSTIFPISPPKTPFLIKSSIFWSLTFWDSGQTVSATFSSSRASSFSNLARILFCSSFACFLVIALHVKRPSKIRWLRPNCNVCTISPGRLPCIPNGQPPKPISLKALSTFLYEYSFNISSDFCISKNLFIVIAFPSFQGSDRSSFSMSQ